MTQVISQKYPRNTGYYEQGDWADHWLGRTVEFKLLGYTMRGNVTGTERYFLANGIHDILEIELIGDSKQVKIQMHRQAVKIVTEEG